MADLEESLFRPASSFPPRGIEYSLSPARRKGFSCPLGFLVALVSPAPLGRIRLGFLPLLPPKPAQTVERKRGREQEDEEVILHAAPDVIRISPSTSCFLPLFLFLFPSPKFPFPVAAAEYGGQRSYSHR